LFTQALALFRAHNWRAAADAFRTIRERFGGDGPSRYYLERCQELAAADPGEQWDGTIVVTQK
jgi:adenylate cyclase